MNFRITLGCLLLFFASVSSGQEPRWIASWGASPEPPRQLAAGPFLVTPGFNNQSIRQFVRLSAGGNQVRLRLTNEYGEHPLDIGAASVGRVGPDGKIRFETLVPVTFDGGTSTTIAPGAPLVSDPVNLPIDELEMLSVTLYFPGETGQCTCHLTGFQTAYVSAEGDFTLVPFVTTGTILSRAFLSGVDVSTTDAAYTLVMLGDSITDGVGSTPDANQRWPDRLAERLAEHSGTVSWGVVNAGISGNRILNDGAGESALARFDRDVLDIPGVTHVVVLEGINDIGIGLGILEGPLADFVAEMPRGEISADSMIAGYRQLIARAHSRGIKIYGATIIPYKGAGYYSNEGDRVREAVNEWIRESNEFDAVLDFDAVLKDPGDPMQIAEGLHSGDFLHGSDAGYRRLADSIDLGLFE